MNQVKDFSIAVFKTLGLYLGMVLFGTAIFMFLSNLVGYLPYSDRPGPGWYGWFPLRSLAEIGGAAWFYLSWALFAAPFFLMYALIPVISLVALRLTRVSSWFLAVVAALALGFLGQYVIAGMGWYIAIGRPAVIAAALLGLLCGACFPFLVRPLNRQEVK